MFSIVKMHFCDQPAATGLEVAKEIAADEAKLAKNARHPK